jgi:hypothetical protein
MDAHQLAIAALNEVTQSSHRRDFPGVAIPDPNATGAHSMNNAIDDNAVDSQEPSQVSSGTKGVMIHVGGSQESQYSTIQATSSNNSQSTTDGHDAATPPTSTSDGFSSQSTNQDGQLSQLSQLSQLAAAQQPLKNISAARQTLPNGPTAGHKRTADGQVKPPSPPSPQASNMRGHSRNTSAVSNVSVASSRLGEVNKNQRFQRKIPNILQLSSELRTRLSYAMVKVNNGWQSNTIDEVESLASQAGSPTSSTSTLHGRRNPITSPRAAIASIQEHANVPINTITRAPTSDFDLYSRTEPAQLTYESFWRGHSTAVPPPRSSHITSPSSSKAGLAPPADIRPEPSSRRSHTPKFSKPPTIPGQGSSSSHTSMPRTPNRGDFNIESKPLQTPTQKTIQEQDAIETLLFMSSPGNSGNMGHQFPGSRTNQTSPQNSPLRAEFNIQDRARGALGRRVYLGKGPTGGVTSTGEQSYTQRNALDTSKSRGDAIDKMLDEMGDSSSDEEELALNYSSPRRVAAGRV